MNQQEYLEFHREFCDRMIEVTAKKNADYTGNNKSAFANFGLVESLGLCSTEKGFLVRMCDKISRISTFVSKGELLVEDETVLDTLIDLANYSALLAGYIFKDKLEGESHE